MKTCGDCLYWNTAGFGLRESYGSRSIFKVAEVGKCTLVARDWFPEAKDKMIALSGLEHTNFPISELISVITRREFACNQFRINKEKSA